MDIQNSRFAFVEYTEFLELLSLSRFEFRFSSFEFRVSSSSRLESIVQFTEIRGSSYEGAEIRNSGFAVVEILVSRLSR